MSSSFLFFFHLFNQYLVSGKKSWLSDNKHGEYGYGKLVSCIWFLDSVQKSCFSNNKYGKYEHGKFVSSLISIFIVFGLSKT